MKYRIIKILITGGIITLSFALQSSFSLLNYRSVANSKSAFNYDMHIWIYEGL